jgi:acetyl-CoA acetyltransferase
MFELKRDEGNRPDTNMEGLAKLKPVMGEGASSTGISTTIRSLSGIDVDAWVFRARGVTHGDRSAAGHCLESSSATRQHGLA